MVIANGGRRYGRSVLLFSIVATGCEAAQRDRSRTSPERFPRYDASQTPFYSAVPHFSTGTDTPRALLERCLSRLAEFEPTVGAFVHCDSSLARRAADASTERWRAGRPLSPIDGMPIGIKDIIETADMPTGQGSPLFTGLGDGARRRQRGRLARGRRGHPR